MLRAPPPLITTFPISILYFLSLLSNRCFISSNSGKLARPITSAKCGDELSPKYPNTLFNFSIILSISSTVILNVLLSISADFNIEDIETVIRKYQINNYVQNVISIANNRSMGQDDLLDVTFSLENNKKEESPQ